MFWFFFVVLFGAFLVMWECSNVFVPLAPEKWNSAGHVQD